MGDAHEVSFELTFIHGEGVGGDDFMFRQQLRRHARYGPHDMARGEHEMVMHDHACAIQLHAVQS
jgi:hypothetical protein